jgi:hypothetical protein
MLGKRSCKCQIYTILATISFYIYTRMSSRTLLIQTNEQILYLKTNLIIPPPWQHTLLIIRSYGMVTPIQNELPTFRILLFRVRNVTKEDNRGVMSGSFYNQCKRRRMPKVWFYPKDSEKRRETPITTTATV